MRLIILRVHEGKGCAGFLWLSHNESNPLSPPRELPYRFPFSCCFSPVSYACLATLRVDFLLRYCVVSALTRSVFVAEVTQVNKISLTPLFTPIESGWPVAWGIRCQSSQASQSIHYPRNHTRCGDGGCCISWQRMEWWNRYSDLLYGGLIGSMESCTSI